MKLLITTVGCSLGVIIPKPVLEMLKMEKGEVIEVEFKKVEK